MILTVIIPVYNQADWLSEALEGLKSQTDREFQLVISDNCSTDHISDVIETYKEINNLTYIKEEEFLEKTSNWNRAVNYSKTEYTLLHHSDDILVKNCIEKIKNFIYSYPEVDLFHGCHHVIDANSNIIKYNKKNRYCKLQVRRFNLLSYMNNVSIVGVTFKTKKFKAVGGFSLKYKQVQDWDFYLKLIQQNSQILNTGCILGYWRIGRLSDELQRIQTLETIELLYGQENIRFKSINIKEFIKSKDKFFLNNIIFKNDIEKVYSQPVREITLFNNGYVYHMFLLFMRVLIVIKCMFARRKK